MAERLDVREDARVTGSPEPARTLVGREEEQRSLRRVLDSAASGDPCAVVVHGEAGVGKTRLVRELVDSAGAGPYPDVLWATCVQFGASTLPFAPMLSALRDVLPRSSVPHSSGRLLTAIDAAINRYAAHGLTVLVVDDLQWADVSSLDVLAYLIAGFRDQKLAIVATCRDENRPEGHPLHSWLADMRRMPSFTELSLGRLDVQQTAALLAQLHGGVPDLELAALVRARADGNPYLTELLGTDIEPGAHVVPDSTPHRLRDALTATWHRLDPVARELSRILAVGGRPVERQVLSAVAAAHGIEAAAVGPALAAGTAQGVLEADHAGWWWFRHPLLADVLYEGIPPEAAVRSHATFAAILASRPASAAADLAVHHERAGNHDEAFTWSLQAAAAAAAVHASAEEAQQLAKACALWPRVADSRRGSPLDRVDLLYRAAHASRLSSQYDAAQRLLEEARSLVDERVEPLLSSRLLSEWCEVTWEASGPNTSLVQERYDALRLTEAFPDSPERATTLGRLAEAEYWDDDLAAARAHADAAVMVARRHGSDLAVARALNIWAFVHFVEFGPAMAAVEEALRLARRCGDVKEIVLGSIWLMNLLTGQLRLEEAVNIGRQAFAEASRLGDLHWCYFIAMIAADDLLLLGRFSEAGDLLREALAVRCVGVPGAATRLIAAQLAMRTGQLDTARRHLDRALEVVEPDFAGIRGSMVATEAELRLAQGDPAAAQWVEQRGFRADGEVEGPHRDKLYWFLWLARAQADVAQHARDTGDREAERLAVHEVAHWADVVDRENTGPADVRTAEDELALLTAAAEVARCRGDADEVERWEQVILATRSAGLRWDEACALRRFAQAAIRHHAPHSVVAATLRRLHHLAAAMGAHPLRQESERLARVARVSLLDPRAVPEQTDERTGRAGPTLRLTPREQEILSHLVAGRTNTEIAASLVISDKTVSVHVSNILRKTGTSSRTEAAAWALRGSHR